MYILILSLSLFFSNSLLAKEKTLPKETTQIHQLISSAEKAFYQFEGPMHLDQAARVLAQIEKANPSLPYVHWAWARLAFWKKEEYYILEEENPGRNYDREKLIYADACHKHTNQCIRLAPKNAECHLIKGACYAMQASTWGNQLRTLKVLKKMDREWRFAQKLPSNFTHKKTVSTRQLAKILHAILYRVMPDSWWLKLLAGIRGNKKKAYKWMKEAINEELLRDPIILLEAAVTFLCYGKKKKGRKMIEEGMDLLYRGLTYPVRHSGDVRDFRNMKYLLGHPEEACNYRRERFEIITRDKIKE